MGLRLTLSPVPRAGPRLVKEDKNGTKSVPYLRLATPDTGIKQIPKCAWHGAPGAFVQVNGFLVVLSLAPVPNQGTVGNRRWHRAHQKIKDPRPGALLAGSISFAHTSETHTCPPLAISQIRAILPKIANNANNEMSTAKLAAWSSAALVTFISPYRHATAYCWCCVREFREDLTIA